MWKLRHSEFPEIMAFEDPTLKHFDMLNINDRWMTKNEWRLKKFIWINCSSVKNDQLF